MSIKGQSINQYSLFRRFQSDMAIRLLCNPRYRTWNYQSPIIIGDWQFHVCK